MTISLLNQETSTKRSLKQAKRAAMDNDYVKVLSTIPNSISVHFSCAYLYANRTHGFASGKTLMIGWVSR